MGYSYRSRLSRIAVAILAMLFVSILNVKPAAAWCIFFCSSAPATTPATTTDGPPAAALAITDEYDLIDQYANLSSLTGQDLDDVVNMIATIRQNGGTDDDVNTFLTELDADFALLKQQSSLRVPERRRFAANNYVVLIQAGSLVADIGTCITPSPGRIAICLGGKALKRVGQAMVAAAARALADWMASEAAGDPTENEKDNQDFLNNTVGISGAAVGRNIPGPDFPEDGDPGPDGKKKWWEIKQVKGDGKNAVNGALDRARENFNANGAADTVDPNAVRVLLDSRLSSTWGKLEDIFQEVVRRMGSPTQASIKEVIVRAADGWRRWTRP